jgi:hypothetical protein
MRFWKRKKAKAKKKDKPEELTGKTLVKKLKQFAKKEKLKNSKASRDLVKLEIYEQAIEALNLPAASKTKAKLLLAKRMRIDNTRLLIERIEKADLEAVLIIFKDLRSQLLEHPELTQEYKSPEIGHRQLVHHLTNTIKELENVKKAERVFKPRRIVLAVDKESLPGFLVWVASRANRVLAGQSLGDEAEKFNDLISVAQKHLDKKFPFKEKQKKQFTKDFLKGPLPKP